MVVSHQKITKISIILPVINEKPNLELLIPELIAQCTGASIEFEILIVDDSSTDGTQEWVRSVAGQDERVRIIDRIGKERSLPDSISEGIDHASSSSVIWMDADGSMPASLIPILVATANHESVPEDSVVVGSRFVVGGGFKGVEVFGETTISDVYRNLRKSEDSFAAVILSRVLNFYLWLSLGRCCKDPTSGYVLASTKYVQEVGLVGSYGDYCPSFLFQAQKNGKIIIEVPYICLPRRFGVSKTGTTLFGLIRRGLPYVFVPWRVRYQLRHSQQLE